ncbi:MAG: hypothetical protein HY720_26095 [Planctomycetes bacterium]|nr:hypothetical protein [Planctomycetota bacterium]
MKRGNALEAGWTNVVRAVGEERDPRPLASVLEGPTAKDWRVVDLGRDEFRVHYLSQGQLDDWSVLQAESDAVYARLRYLNAYAQVVISRQRVETAVGRGGPPRTVEVSSWAEANRVREGG